MKKVSRFTGLLAFSSLFILLFSCTAPRSIITSGRVTPYQQIRGGANYNLNFSTNTTKQLFNGIEDITTTLVNKDTVILDEQVVNVNKALLAYSLDPINTGFDAYVRYGIIKRLDLGYRYTSKTHVFDAAFQFLGHDSSATHEASPVFGSIGFQYSGTSVEMPSLFGLNMTKDLFNYKISRKDFIVPLIITVPFGKWEKYGSISIGGIYSHTLLKYTINADKIYSLSGSNNIPVVIPSINEKKSFNSFGTFINLKIGYQYIYLLPACSFYWQNYGSFPLVNGERVTFKGATIIPSVGLQITTYNLIGSGKLKKNKRN